MDTNRYLTTASEMGTDELLRNLGRFSSSVLPIGVLRELQSRGDAIHDSLVAIICKRIDSLIGGEEEASNSAFFAFALLVPIAKNDDRLLIESLLTLPDEAIHFVIGDLVYEAMPRLIANLFRGQPASEVIDWIERLADHPKLEYLDAFPLFRGMTLAVMKGDLDRNTVIDSFVHRLEKWAGNAYDLPSALVVCELIDLSARSLEAVDAVVRASFARDQIDTSYVDLVSWDKIDSHDQSRDIERYWTDASAELSTWCYDFVCDDLDPVNATLRVNELNHQCSRLEKSSIPALIDELRKSNDNYFPREAVQSIDGAFADAYHATLDLIREELARYEGDSDSWSGNGAYLGLVLTIANQLPLPTDLLETILRMPQEDRERVFGDQFVLISRAIALTPLHQYEFIDQWIWDANRSNADRREMIEAYLYGYYHNAFDREVVIDAFVAGLRRSLIEEPILIAPYAESLALLAPKEHSHLLEEAFERNDVEWFLPFEDLRRMVWDAKFAFVQLQQRFDENSGALQIISSGVMFNWDVLQEKPRYIPPPHVYQPRQEEFSTTTIRNDARTPRNALCPCGSGKKFKKCCLHK